MNFGDKIKHYRNINGLTQQELADKVGISVRALSNYENELRNPSLETIIKISDALGISPQKLKSQLIKSPEMEYLFTGYGRIALEENEDQRGNDFKRVAELFEEYDYEINEISDGGINKVEISTLKNGTLATLEENDFINRGNELLNEVEEIIKLQIKQFINRNK